MDSRRGFLKRVGALAVTPMLGSAPVGVACTCRDGVLGGDDLGAGVKMREFPCPNCDPDRHDKWLRDHGLGPPAPEQYLGEPDYCRSDGAKCGVVFVHPCAKRDGWASIRTEQQRGRFWDNPEYWVYHDLKPPEPRQQCAYGTDEYGGAHMVRARGLPRGPDHERLDKIFGVPVGWGHAVPMRATDIYAVTATRLSSRGGHAIQPIVTSELIPPDGCLPGRALIDVDTGHVEWVRSL